MYKYVTLKIGRFNAPHRNGYLNLMFSYPFIFSTIYNEWVKDNTQIVYASMTHHKKWVTFFVNLIWN